MFAKIAVSVAVGFIGAYPLAVSSGLFGVVNQYNQGSLMTACGLVLFFVTICLIGPISRLIPRVLEGLNRLEERPKPAVALTMLVLGTVLAIAAMVIQYNAGSRSSAGLSMNLNGFGQNSQMAMQQPGSLGLVILTFASFLLGAALVALGIWASLKPAETSKLKPSVREFDDFAT